MDPKQKTQIEQFTLAAKAIIYDAKRMKSFIKMLDTQAGAIQAVETVIGGIEQTKPLPPEIAPMIAANVYLLLVEVAEKATGKKSNPEVMKATITALVEKYRKSYGEQQAVQPEQQPAQPQPEPAGLMALGE